MKCIKYKVTHTSEYYYNEPVPLCHNLIRLWPRDTAHQKCLKCNMTISPVPAERRDRVDFFGNQETWVSLQEPHKVLRIEAASEVEVRESVPPADPNAPSWESVAQLLSWRGDMGRPPDPVVRAVREYTFDSPQLKASPELADYARPSFPPGRPLLAAVTELTERIYKEFTFDSRATTVGTPVLGRAPQPPRRLPGLRPSPDRLPPLTGPGGPVRQRVRPDPPRRRARNAWSWASMHLTPGFRYFSPAPGGSISTRPTTCFPPPTTSRSAGHATTTTSAR